MINNLRSEAWSTLRCKLPLPWNQLESKLGMPLLLLFNVRVCSCIYTRTRKRVEGNFGRLRKTWKCKYPTWVCASNESYILLFKNYKHSSLATIYLLHTKYLQIRVRQKAKKCDAEQCQSPDKTRYIFIRWMYSVI